jgi:hypothetical protein
VRIALIAIALHSQRWVLRLRSKIVVFRSNSFSAPYS